MGIESSCDDTSAAVLRGTTMLSNVIASQAVHVKYGGVIPELASRAHQQNIVPVIDTALKDAGITADQIDAIAFTRGPGLLGSLLVGVSFAKGLSLAKNNELIENALSELYAIGKDAESCEAYEARALGKRIIDTISGLSDSRK